MSKVEPTKTRPLLVEKKCADLVVLGVRGSGQSADHNHGVGQELYRTVRSMAAQLHNSSNATVRLESVDYQSDRNVNYYAGVADGRAKLHRQFVGLLETCPQSKVAFLGFSQGAQTVHEYAFDLPADKAKQVALIGMLSDPRNNIDDDIDRWSYADEATDRSGKLGAGERFDEAARTKAISLCAAKDEICNWPRSGGPANLSETHKHFYEKPANARSTASALVKMLHQNGLS